jgi:hypothetical protein
MTKTALWRRVSTDSHYIIYRSGGLVFVAGTQSAARVQELLDYMNNIPTSDLHPHKEGRITRYLLREKGLEIVDNTCFGTITNKHIFTNLK